MHSIGAFFFYRCCTFCVCVPLCLYVGHMVRHAKTDEPIEMPFDSDHVGPGSRLLDGGAHWRHLVNTIE